MTFIDQTTSREDLQVIILNEKALYGRFNEARFLNDEYTSEELREAIVSFLEEGDECALS